SSAARPRDGAAAAGRTCNEGIIAAAPDRLVNDGSLGNADIVDAGVATGERPGSEADSRVCAKAGEIQRVIGAAIPDGDYRIGIDGEIEILLGRAGDIAMESKCLTTGRERPRRRRAIDACAATISSIMGVDGLACPQLVFFTPSG